MSLNRAFSALTLIVAGFATACAPTSNGKWSPGAGAPAELEVCRLMSQAEAERAVDHPLAKMTSLLTDELGRDPGKCTFGTPQGEEPHGVVSLEVREYPSAEEARRAQDGTEGPLGRISGSPARKVDNLAESAYWVGGLINQLHVLHGSFRLIVTVEVGLEVNRPDSAERLARQALGRLEGALAEERDRQAAAERAKAARKPGPVGS